MKKEGFKWGYLPLGILLALVGISFIAFSYTLTFLAVALGISLAVYGIVYGVINISGGERSLSFVIKLIIAVAALVGGVVVLILRENTIGIIIDIILLMIIIDGSFKLKSAAHAKRVGALSWWVMLILSVVTIAPAFILSKLHSLYPESTEVSIVLGVLIIIDGIANFLLPFIPDESGAELKREEAADSIKGTDTPSAEKPKKKDFSPER